MPHSHDALQVRFTSILAIEWRERKCLRWACSSASERRIRSISISISISISVSVSISVSISISISISVSISISIHHICTERGHIRSLRWACSSASERRISSTRMASTVWICTLVRVDSSRRLSRSFALELSSDVSVWICTLVRVDSSRRLSRSLSLELSSDVNCSTVVCNSYPLQYFSSSSKR
jgi:hypothetical protein